jgi:ABC-type dipeptide/oligopeptide/nickel transport system permease subunit
VAAEEARELRHQQLLFGRVFCLTVTIYRLNMFGDAVRDLLDPRLRGETTHDH